MRDLIARTLREIEATLAPYANPLVAYSGGKDGLVAHDLVNRVRPGVAGYFETAFYFEAAVEDALALVSDRGYVVEARATRDYAWLAAHREFVFTDDPNVRSRSFSLRQQRGVKRQARHAGHDVIVTGRRADHNTVPAKHYVTSAGPQYHPIRDWSTDDVWAYIDAVLDVPRPWIYRTRFGARAGNTAWYTLRRRDFGGDDEGCWALVDELEPTIRPRWEAALRG